MSELWPEFLVEQKWSRTKGEEWKWRKIKELFSKRRNAPKGFVAILKQYCFKNSFRGSFLKGTSWFLSFWVVFPHPGSNCRTEAQVVKQRAGLWGPVELGVNWGSSSDYLCDIRQVSTPLNLSLFTTKTGKVIGFLWKINENEMMCLKTLVQLLAHRRISRCLLLH